jgi:hypothetical protein
MDVQLKTLTEFQNHIILHRKRVVRLGLALAQEHYPGLEAQALGSFLRLHDLSKTLKSEEKLQQYGYNHPKLPVERLFSFYGINHRSHEQLHELREIILDINTVDEKVAQHYFSSFLKGDEATMEAFFQIERVADLVDRSLDPVAAEEFGHPMILASDYIQDFKLSQLSLWLEKKYLHLTKNLSFQQHSILFKVD